MFESSFSQTVALILGLAIVSNVAVRLLAHFGYPRASKAVQNFFPFVVAALSSPTKEQALLRLLEAVNGLPVDDPRALRARLEAEALAELAKLPKKPPSVPPGTLTAFFFVPLALALLSGCITAENMRTTVADVEDLRRKGNLVIVAADAACEVAPRDPDLNEACDAIAQFSRLADDVYRQWRRIVCLVAPEQCI